MKVFLDTSSLFKLYYREVGTDEMDSIFSENNVKEIFLSEITNVEFISAVFKKVRMNELNIDDARKMISLFENDLKRYTIVRISSATIENAKLLIMKYGHEGLRTLDALQFASAIEIKNLANKYFAADKLLLSLFEKEHLPAS